MGSVGGLILGGSITAYAAHKLDQIPLSAAKAETAQIDAEYSAYKATVATNAAKATADALKDKTAQDALANTLQAQLAQTQKDADARSKTLLAALAKAQPGDIRVLGPSALAYYDGVRQSQASTGHPAGSGNQ